MKLGDGTVVVWCISDLFNGLNKCHLLSNPILSACGAALSDGSYNFIDVPNIKL
jgi:hypothetical protein